MKGVEGWGAQRSDFIFKLKTTQGEINNHEPEPAKTKRKVLYLGLAEKRFFSLVTILTSNAKARNANPLRTSLALGFHFFSTEKRKGGPLCVSANRQGRTKKKKSLFLNFQRTEKTQRKQKQGWTEIILKLNIRFFFRYQGNLRIPEIFRIPNDKAKASWFVDVENALCCFDSFLYLLSGVLFQEESLSST